jgi:hypothetical protein
MAAKTPKRKTVRDLPAAKNPKAGAKTPTPPGGPIPIPYPNKG